MCKDGRSALVTREEIAVWNSEQDALIMAISHCWESREHPDPLGHQLAQIANSTSLYCAAYGVPIWLFFDYVSLFQYEREPGQQETSFKEAMKNMHVFYAHDFSFTLRVETLASELMWIENLDKLVTIFHQPDPKVMGSVKPTPLRELTRNDTPYGDRGWCQAELEWSSCRRESYRNQPIDLSYRNQGTGKGKAPLHPDIFQKQMVNLKFTHRSDLEPVLQLQAGDCFLVLLSND